SASAKKAKPEEVRAWAARGVKVAEAHGPRFQQSILLSIAEGLTGEGGDYGGIAGQDAKQAERLLDADTKPAVQKQTLTVLAAALEKAGKADEAKEVKAKAEKIDTSFKPAAFAGRKGKSDRVVLVELFTGAQCPPCVAADLAFDAVGKSFKPSEAILLQYHLHIPRPDPLTNQQTLSRARFYDIEATPTVLFNGKPGAQGGGGEDAVEEKYEEYNEVLTDLLEKPAGAKIALTAKQDGNKIDIKAEVSDLTATGNSVRLRLVLVEEEVKYTGSNKLPSHHHVVRAFPGGADGLALKEKTGKQEVSVDLEDVRKEIKTYVDKMNDKTPFAGKLPEIELKNLKVVAFVQNDDTGEVLQAAVVELGK